MADTPEKDEPRIAVVIHAADGRRLKPKCPMCGRTYWGRLVPPGYEEGAKLINTLPVSVADQPVHMHVQLWTCLNCGFLWHRTGSVDQKPVDRESND